MPHDINSALERLEQNLEKLDSARNQVLNTVNASNKLTEIVGIYVTSVQKLANNLQAWSEELSAREASLNEETKSSINEINKSCDLVISAFSTKADSISDNFKTKTEESVKSFSDENTNFKQSIENLKDLHAKMQTSVGEITSIKVSIDQLLKDLNDSQSKQDEDLRVIKEDLSNLPTTIKNSETTITQSIDNSEKRLSSVLSQIKTDINACINKGDAIARDISSLQKTAGAIQSAIAELSSTQAQRISSAKDEIITNISEKSSNINAGIESLKVTCQSISASITNHTKELKDEIEAARNESAKASKINRIIMIIGIIGLALLLFLVK